MAVTLQDTYLYKLHHLTGSIDRLFDSTLKKHVNISLSQFLLLFAILQYPSGNQRQMSIFLGYSRAAVKRQVEIAIRNGLLNVRSDPKNRRQQILNLTPLGQEMLQSGLSALEQYAFGIFAEENRQMGLMQHLDALLTNIEEVQMSVQIPKARQLFRGDINDAVIRVQQATGVHIDEKWWNANVGNDGDTKQILDRFDKAYAIEYAKRKPQEKSR